MKISEVFEVFLAGCGLVSFFYLVVMVLSYGFTYGGF